jgi:hypothetical protein
MLGSTRKKFIFYNKKMEFSDHVAWLVDSCEEGDGERRVLMLVGFTGFVVYVAVRELLLGQALDKWILLLLIIREHVKTNAKKS